MNSPRPKSRARTLAALALTLAGLAAVGYGTSLLDRPLSDFTVEELIVLDAAAARPEQGLAWQLPLERPDLESDADGGRSELVLYEDGVAMDGHRSHQRVREEGLGMYSHWRDNLIFATSDGSDPRSNGRTYELRLEHDPDESMPGHAGQLIKAGLAAVALALVLRLGLVSLVGVVAAVALVALNRYENQVLDHMDAVVAGLDERLAAPPSGADAPQGERGRLGNTSRLLAGDGPIDFAPTAPAPAALEPAVVHFAPTPSTEGKGDLFLLAGGDSGLVGTPDRPLAVRDLHEAILELRIVEGSVLRIEFRDDQGAVVHGLELPVTAGNGWQTLRISQPLSLAVLDGSRSIGSVLLTRASAAGSRGDLRGAARQMIVSDEMATFRRAPHGSHLAEVSKQMRRAHYQGVAGSLHVAWPDADARVLKGAVAVGGANRNRSLDWSVAVEDRAGTRHALAAGAVVRDDGWLSFRAELPAGLEPAAAVLSCDAIPEDCVLEWAGVRVVDTRQPPRRVLLTLMDTLRADALACYGHPGNRTPALDALAARGVLFENNFSQTYWTRPSMPSIMTGRYTVATGVHSVGQQLPGRYETLAEAFAGAGFYTFANISNTNAGPDAGLEQGFDEMSLSLLGQVTKDTDDQVRHFVEPRLDDLLEEDLLLYVHLMEAHGPYGPVERPEDFDAPPGKRLEYDKDLDRGWYREPTDAGRVALYNRDVQTMDASWGAFVERTLARWDQAGGESPVLAILADHGEFLGEYGRWSHVQYKLVPEVTHTPLIVTAPGQLPEGRRIATPTENIDLAPTLLELVGLSPALLGAIDGDSLVTLAREGQDARHGLAISSAGAGASLIGMYLPGFGLVGTNGAIDGTLLPGVERGLSFQPVPDPMHQTVHEYRVREALGEHLSQAWDVYRETRLEARDALWADVDTSATAMDPEALQQLVELGYLQGGEEH